MKKIALILLLSITMSWLSSCDEKDAPSVVFTALIPDEDISSQRPGSIIKDITMSQGINSFNLSARWKDGDVIQLFVRQGGKIYQVENLATVFDISADGKKCSFNFTMPSLVNESLEYEIIGVTGIDAHIEGQNVVVNSSMKRIPLENGNTMPSPMWFIINKTNLTTGNRQVQFKHLGTYEVLSVNNNSTSSITFKHCGFFSYTFPWYLIDGSIVIGSKAGTASNDTEQTDVQSDDITIAPGAVGAILSWYIPIGRHITLARLHAIIDGQEMTSIDMMRYSKNIESGKAYYMQATWDGSALYFSNDFCPDGNHPHAIDLGLPSGTKWACCNVGANDPTRRGGYYAWGEISQKDRYEQGNYKWWDNGDYTKITKYCRNGDFGVVDGRMELEPEDDVAFVNLGTGWRMPSRQQVEELINNCSSSWMLSNGIPGRVFRSNINNELIFMPAGGYFNGEYVRDYESTGLFWSRSFPTSAPYLAHGLAFSGGSVGWAKLNNLGRHNGCNVRAVYVGQE